MKGRCRLAVLGLGMLVWAGVASAATPPPVGPAAAPPVQVRIEKMTFPVKQSPPPEAYPHLKVNAKLSGKETYTTEAVILENEYVKAVILPEFGGRLPHVTFKASGRDLFWVHDVLEDNLPWSMGGIRFSFPFAEYGRHMDESAGYRVVRQPDGAATVAMDMRFGQYPDELGRYGRFSALRQAIYVTLRPGTSVLEYTARVDNPLPLRHGFRLWSIAHFPRKSGAEVLLPAGAVTDEAAAEMRPWPVWGDVDHSVLGTWGASAFSVDPQGDWAGLYLDGANHLLLRPRYTAPGTRLCATEVKAGIKEEAGRWDSMVEIWHGSNPVFEHPGHYLPPFGTYIMPLRLTLVAGIGKVDWANEAVAIAYTPSDRGGTVRVVSFEVKSKCRIMARTDQETITAKGMLRPEWPLAVDLTKPARQVLVTVMDDNEMEIAEVTLPWRPKPVPPETFKTLQGELKPWNWLAMELSDWPHAQAPGISEAAKTLLKDLTAEKTEAVLSAARLAMRTEPPGSATWVFIRTRLEQMASRNPENRYVPAYLGLMMVLETKGKVTPEAAKHLAAAGTLPAGHYLLALQALAEGKPVNAIPHLKRCASEPPPVAMGLGSSALQGNERTHPAALPGGQWPTMLLAATLLGFKQPDGAIAELERLLMDDPARPEALALLADAYAAAKQADKAQAAREDAQRLFTGNEQARKDYDALVRESRLGLWAGIPRP